MLVRLTDIKGKPVWINPIYVKAVYAKPKYTVVDITLNTSLRSVLKVSGSVEGVVEAINLAMPEILPPLPPDDESGPDAASGGVAGAAVLMG